MCLVEVLLRCRGHKSPYYPSLHALFRLEGVPHLSQGLEEGYEEAMTMLEISSTHHLTNTVHGELWHPNVRNGDSRHLGHTTKAVRREVGRRTYMGPMVVPHGQSLRTTKLWKGI